MASNRIRGITIDIDGNTTKLTDSLKAVDKQLKSTEADLKDVNKLLKLDPSNTELLAQKQKVLADAVSNTKEKLDEFRKFNFDYVDCNNTKRIFERIILSKKN